MRPSKNIKPNDNVCHLLKREACLQCLVYVQLYTLCNIYPAGCRLQSTVFGQSFHKAVLLKRWVFSAECAWTIGPRDMTRAQIKLGSGRRGRRPAASRGCPPLHPRPTQPHPASQPSTTTPPLHILNPLTNFPCHLCLSLSQNVLIVSLRYFCLVFYICYQLKNLFFNAQLKS